MISDIMIYNCPVTQHPIVIDGVLDEPIWEEAPKHSLVNSETGEQTAQATYVRMCRDQKYLYVAFECEDSHIWATMSEHDDSIYEEEVVEVFIDPAGDFRCYYELEISPANVTFDGIMTPSSAEDKGYKLNLNWTCEGWRTAVAVDGTVKKSRHTVGEQPDKGWNVEMAIPFEALGTTPPSPGDRWRINLYRIDRTPDKDEYQAWSPTMTSPAAFHVPERFGTIVFG